LRYEHEEGLKKKLLMLTEKIPGLFAHKVICISPSIKKKSIEDNLFKESKMEVIAKGSSNGINLENFNRNKIDTTARLKLKQELNIENHFIYGFVGRLIDRKGIKELVHAFLKVNNEFPDTRLVLVGKKDITQLSDSNILKTIESNPAIIWVGWQDNIPLFMSVFDVFVMPAWWEGFGNAYIEAASMNIPVIGSNGTGCIDAVNHNHNGLIVKTKDEEALFKTMMKYYKNSDLRKEHGANGASWVQNFKQKTIWEGLEKIYIEDFKQ